MIDDQNAIKKLKNADKTARENAKSLDKVKTAAVNVGKAMVVGIGAAAATLTTMAFKAAEATDRIDKMSQQLGLSRQGFQEWDYVLSQNGVSIDSMKGGMKTLTNMTDDLRKGTATATDAFGRLGISMEDLEGKTQEETFNMVVNSLQGVEDEAQRAAIANDLLGRSGADLAPLLNAGADSAENLKQQARDLGLVLSDEAIDSGVEFTDTMDTLKRSFGTLASEIGVAVMPIMQNMAEWLMDNMPEIKRIAGEAFDKVGDSIKWVKDNSDWLLPVLGSMLGAFLAFKAIAVITTLMGAFAAVQGAVAAAGGIMNAIMLANPAVLIAVGIGVLVAGLIVLVRNFDKVKEGAAALWGSIKNFFGKIGDFIGNIFGGIKDKIKMPKFTIEGSMNPLKWLKNGVPKLNVKWNAEGGIFKKPTIFGTSAGYQGVGEAGAEAIMPLSKLQSMLDMNNNEIDYTRLAQELKYAMSGMKIVLDDEEVGTFVDGRLVNSLKGGIA